MFSKAWHTALGLLFSFAAGLAGSASWTYWQATHAPAPISTQPAFSSAASKLPEDSVTRVAAQMRDSVVSIVATKELEYALRDPFSLFFNDPFLGGPFGGQFRRPQPEQPETRREKKQVGAGTGFFVTADGWLLTNRHVVEDAAAEYTVVLADGTKLPAEVVARDGGNDLAIVKIKDANGRKFTPVSFVSAANKVKVGQLVVAIGNALGQFDNTVTLGVISAAGRSITAGDGSGSAEQLRELLQTDAAINPGNSGGPLVALTGQVVGVNTAVAGGAQGIGFAIPLSAEKVTKMLEQIRSHGKILRPYLGVRYQMVTPELNQQLKLGTDRGAWLHGENDLPAVLADSPAAAAGLRGGDIVLSVDGRTVDDTHDLAGLLADRAPGETVKLTVLRDNARQEISVKLGELPEATEAAAAPTQE